MERTDGEAKTLPSQTGHHLNKGGELLQTSRGILSKRTQLPVTREKKKSHQNVLTANQGEQLFSDGTEFVLIQFVNRLTIIICDLIGAVMLFQTGSALGLKSKSQRVGSPVAT